MRPIVAATLIIAASFSVTTLTAQERSSPLPPGLERMGALEELNNPLLQQLLDERDKGLTAAQRSVLEQAVREMSAVEVDSTLRQLNLSTWGSERQRRDRLMVALDLAPPPDLPPTVQPQDILIENAGDGEYLQGSDDGRRLLRLSGRVRVTTRSGVFTADRVIVDVERQEIFAEGNLYYRSNDGATEVVAERAIYNQLLGSGIIYNADGYTDPVHFVGESIKVVDGETLAVSHAWFTASSRELPPYNFYARRVWLYGGDRPQMVAVGVIYMVGGIPMLPMPFFYASNWGTGVSTQFGHSTTQGYFMQNTYQFSVPQAMLTSWQPIAYRFKLDFYERTGTAGGIEMMRFSPQLNYFIDLGAAEFRRYDIVGDFRQRNQIRFTNHVMREDGTYGRELHQWYKAFVILNARHQDLQKNHVRNFHIRYDDYSHRLYEYEFGGRYQPTSTIPSLYQNSEAGRGLIRDTTGWQLTYSESWDDLTLNVAARRDKRWIDHANMHDSRYAPHNEVLPEVEILKRFDLGQIPFTSLPLWWDHRLYSDIRKEYSYGRLFKSYNNNAYTTSLRTAMSWYPWISFEPRIGYGAQRTNPYLERHVEWGEKTDIDDLIDHNRDMERLEAEAKKRSFQFWFTEDKLTLGPHQLYLSATYRRRDSFKEEQKDVPEINPWGYRNEQIINETELELGTNPLPNWNFTLTSIYDHRDFLYDVENSERWSYPIFRTNVYFDFINPLRPDRENLLSRNRVHFLGLNLSNDYIYDPFDRKPHSNIAGISLEAGGFDLWLLQRLRYLETGFYWYHVYFDSSLDHMRYYTRLDVQLTRNLFFEMELESRATEVERYSRRSRDEQGKSDYIAFEHDLINGLGLRGQRNRQNAVFNIGYFEGALVLDLEDWEMRLGYSIENRSAVAGLNTFEVVNFYDNRVFFSLTFLRFDIARTADRPSRFILDRRRVRAADIGRLPVSSSFEPQRGF